MTKTIDSPLNKSTELPVAFTSNKSSTPCSSNTLGCPSKQSTPFNLMIESPLSHNNYPKVCSISI